MSSASHEALKPCPVVLVIEDEAGDVQLIKRQLLEAGPAAFVVHLAGKNCYRLYDADSM